jgi:hypothetical protein
MADWFHSSAVDGFNLKPPVLPTMLETFASQMVALVQQVMDGLGRLYEFVEAPDLERHRSGSLGRN